MQQVCNQYAGNFEEDNIYNAYKKDNLKQFLCYGKRGHCAKVAKNQPKKESKKQKNKTKKHDGKEEL